MDELPEALREQAIQEMEAQHQILQLLHSKRPYQNRYLIR